MITKSQQPDGRWRYECDKCNVSLVVKPGDLRNPCRCPIQEIITVACADRRIAAVSARPRVTLTKQPARPDNSDKQRLATPCFFLGEPTGKQHKVGCVARFLPEHKCLHGERQTFLYNSSGKQVKRWHVREPVAIPDGRCRDLKESLGQVSCLDCPLYRAGLLSAPSAAVEGPTTDAS